MQAGALDESQQHAAQLTKTLAQSQSQVSAHASKLDQAQKQMAQQAQHVGELEQQHRQEVKQMEKRCEDLQKQLTGNQLHHDQRTFRQQMRSSSQS